MKYTHIDNFWILERDGQFICQISGGGEVQPDYFPLSDIFRARRFNSPEEASRWTHSPGNGWTDFKPIYVTLTSIIKQTQ